MAGEGGEPPQRGSFRISLCQKRRAVTHPPSTDHLIRDVVTSADQRRRSREAVRLVARLAPFAAGLALVVALVARLAGWRPAVALLVLGVSGVALLTVILIARRARAATDAMARRVDADAGLAGELHSAHWFEAREGATADAWTAYHLGEATRRAEAVAWDRLYPPVAAQRAWVTSGALAAAVIAVSIVLPGRSARAVTPTDQLAATVQAVLPTLSPEMQRQLMALMGDLQSGKLTPEELAAALEGMKKLDPLDPALQKALAELAKAAKEAPKDQARNALDPKDLKKDLKKDAPKDDGSAEDSRWAEEEQASKSANAAANKSDAQEKSGDGQEKSKDAGDEAASASTSMSMQMVRESASQADASQAMMMDGGGGASGDSTPGAGGNTGDKPNQALAALLAQALKKETVEAAADNAGENIDKEDIRRKTEAGRSAMGYSKAAAAAFDKSRAAAPPAVPEARRPLVQSYFVRKPGDRH